MALTLVKRTIITKARGDQVALVEYSGTDQAAGVEFSEAVPAGAAWKLLAVRAQFVADATVATRRHRLVVDDGTNVVAEFPTGIDITASGNPFFNWVDQGAVVSSGSGAFRAVLLSGAVLLGPGYRVRSVTESLQAGDNWGVPTFLVEEYGAK